MASHSLKPPWLHKDENLATHSPLMQYPLNTSGEAGKITTIWTNKFQMLGCECAQLHMYEVW